MSQLKPRTRLSGGGPSWVFSMLYSGGNLSAHRGDGEGDEQGPSLLILSIVQSRLDHVDHLVYHLLLILLLRGEVLWLLQIHADGRGDQKKEGEVEFEHFDGYTQSACCQVFGAQVSIIHPRLGRWPTCQGTAAPAPTHMYYPTIVPPTPTTCCYAPKTRNSDCGLLFIMFKLSYQHQYRKL